MFGIEENGYINKQPITCVNLSLDTIKLRKVQLKKQNTKTLTS